LCKYKCRFPYPAFKPECFQKSTSKTLHYVLPLLRVSKKEGNISACSKHGRHLCEKLELISAFLTPVIFPTVIAWFRTLCQSLPKYLLMSPVFSPLPVLTIAFIKSCKVSCLFINFGQNSHSS